MDLLCGYGSDGGDSDGAGEPTPTPTPTPEVSSGRVCGSVFSKLPPPKAPADGGGSLFSRLPAPKQSIGSAVTKKVMWKPPINTSALADPEPEEDRPKKKSKSRKGGSLLGFLPAPKNVLGGGSGGGTAALLGGGVGSKGSGPVVGARGDQAKPAPRPTAPAPTVQNENNLYRVDANGQYAADLHSQFQAASGHETWAAPAQSHLGTGTVQQYDYFPVDHNAATPYQGTLETLQEQNVAGPSSSGSGAAGDGIAVLQAELERERERQRKLGRNPKNTPQIVSITQEKLKYVAPTANAAANAAQNAFGPQYQAQLRKEAGAKGSKTARRKHQIGTLYHDMKITELEMLEKRTGSQKSKAETAAKYGW